MIKKLSRKFYLCTLTLSFLSLLLVAEQSHSLSAESHAVLRIPSLAAIQEWPTRYKNAERQAATSELILSPLTPLWTRTFPYGDLADRPPLYVAAQGKLFVFAQSGDHTKSLLALDPLTGNELWSKGYIDGRSFEDVTFDEVTNRLYAATSAVFLVIDPNDGTVLNQFPVPSGPSYVRFTMSDGYLYIVAGYYLSKTDLAGNVLWTYKDNSASYGLSDPAVGNGMVYVGSGNWDVKGIDANTGKVVWTSPTAGSPYTAPVIGDGLVFVGCQGQPGSPTVFAYDANSGQIRWVAFTGYGGTVDQAMSYSDGVLYFGSNDQNVYAIDTRTPSLLWTYETINDIESPVVQMGNLVYAVSGCAVVGGLNATLYALDAATGALVSKETVPCSGTGLVPYQGTLIVNSRTWDTGTLLKAFATQEGYHLGVMPNQVTARPGEQAKTQLRISSTFHFTETVQLSASPLPNGITLALSASESPPSGIVTATLNLSPTLSLRGNIPITLTGTTSQGQQAARMQLTVIDPSLFLPLIRR